MEYIDIWTFYDQIPRTSRTALVHVAKTKHNVKTPDTIFYYAYWAYQIVFFCLVINIILGVMSCHDHLRWICSYTLIFREYPQLTHRLALQFLVMPIVFMHIILQTWSSLKSKNLTILVMWNNGIVQCKVTFVEASCFINGISDNNSIIFWKTIVFQQTCARREYDVITMLVLTDVFFREHPLKIGLFTFCFLHTSKQDVG